MERKCFKLNKDDILEIVTESLAKDHGFGTFNSRSDLVVDNDQIYFIGVIGEENDDDVFATDLEKLYRETEYNGTHNGAGCYTDEEWLKILNDIIVRGTF